MSAAAAIVPSAAVVVGPAVLVPGTGVSPQPGAFHLASIMFLRARQLRDGARPRVDPQGHRFSHVAMLEVMARLVSWEHADA